MPVGDPVAWCVCSSRDAPLSFSFFFNTGHYSDPCVLPFTVKEHPDLDSKFDERVQTAVKYTRTIEDFNELIDPRTLARHYLGPEPSLYVLSTLDREEKKRKLPWHPGRISYQSFPSIFFFFFFLSFLLSLVQR